MASDRLLKIFGARKRDDATGMLSCYKKQWTVWVVMIGIMAIEKIKAGESHVELQRQEELRKLFSEHPQLRFFCAFGTWLPL